jgi:hypothetical protein
MALIYSSPLTPLPLICLYLSKLGPSFVADGLSSAKLPSFVGRDKSFVDLYLFLIFTTSNYYLNMNNYLYPSFAYQRKGYHTKRILVSFLLREYHTRVVIVITFWGRVAFN